MFEKYEKVLFAECMNGENGIIKLKVNRLLNRLTVKVYFRGKRVSKKVTKLKYDNSLDLLESIKNPENEFIKEIWVRGWGYRWIDNSHSLDVYKRQFTDYNLEDRVKKILAKERLKTI